MRIPACRDRNSSRPIPKSTAASARRPSPGCLIPSSISATTPPETAYIVTTSGTTGTPKGVLVGSASLCNFIDAMAGVYPQNPVLSLCSPAFDAFLIESICALLNGRSVVFADAEAAENPAQLADYIGRHHIGMLSLTPSRLQAYLRHPAFCQAVSA